MPAIRGAICLLTIPKTPETPANSVQLQNTWPHRVNVYSNRVVRVPLVKYFNTYYEKYAYRVSLGNLATKQYNRTLTFVFDTTVSADSIKYLAVQQSKLSYKNNMAVEMSTDSIWRESFCSFQGGEFL